MIPYYDINKMHHPQVNTIPQFVKAWQVEITLEFRQNLLLIWLALYIYSPVTSHYEIIQSLSVLADQPIDLALL